MMKNSLEKPAFLKDAKKYREDHPYEIDQITMDDLQNATFDSNLL